jgi:hypothetical protein
MKDFVLYDEAIALKDIGFDEECFNYYDDDNDEQKYELFPYLSIAGIRASERIQNQGFENTISTPTYAQSFRWFREKHGLYVSQVPEFYQDGINFNWQILWYLPKEEWKTRHIHTGTFMYGDNGEYPTQEDMELGILKKLIEIVKERNNGRT